MNWKTKLLIFGLLTVTMFVFTTITSMAFGSGMYLD